jgi:hypothetical protein
LLLSVDGSIFHFCTTDPEALLISCPWKYNLSSQSCFSFSVTFMSFLLSILNNLITSIILLDEVYTCNL